MSSRFQVSAPPWIPACWDFPLESSKMEPLTAYPLRCSGPKTKVFAVLLSMVLCTVMLFLLQLKFLKPKINSFYTFEVKDAKGRPVSLEKFKGKVSSTFSFLFLFCLYTFSVYSLTRINFYYEIVISNNL